jgi:hypothetical protein
MIGVDRGPEVLELAAGRIGTDWFRKRRRALGSLTRLGESPCDIVDATLALDGGERLVAPPVVQRLDPAAKFAVAPNKLGIFALWLFRLGVDG